MTEAQKLHLSLELANEALREVVERHRIWGDELTALQIDIAALLFALMTGPERLIGETTATDTATACPTAI